MRETKLFIMTNDKNQQILFTIYVFFSFLFYSILFDSILCHLYFHVNTHTHTHMIMEKIFGAKISIAHLIMNESERKKRNEQEREENQRFFFR